MQTTVEHREDTPTVDALTSAPYLHHFDMPPALTTEAMNTFLSRAYGRSRPEVAGLVLNNILALANWLTVFGRAR